MNIENIVGGLHTSLNELMVKFFLPGGSEFTNNLTLGQIIKGRVMRHYEGNRYLVDFDGQEKVVDSVVPLRTQELIHGKVIAIGERVELQRIRDKATEPQQTPAKTVALEPGLTGSKSQQLMQQVLERYAGRLTVEDNAALLRLMENSSDPHATALVGMALNKLGLNIAPELLRAIFNSWLSSSQHGVFPVAVSAPRLEGAALSSETFVTRETVEKLSQLLAWAIGDIPEKKYIESITQSKTEGAADGRESGMEVANRYSSEGSASGAMQPGTYDLGRWLLNAQTDGVVSHQLGTLPIHLGDRLIEVDIAVFEQRQSQVKEGIRHRQLVFSLHTDSLGHIEVTAKIAGNHLRIRVSTEDPEKTEITSRYFAQLRDTLIEFGWQVDELIYETRDGNERGEVVGAVIEHIISQDSLSRLM
ncbi:MAG TPA: flagellar hook-length control protein FliK [Acidiferrobacterales bacterium]|nr:flagellar hook-length control protein FliK [Acidiferrobacterales bacterium]